MTTKLKWLGNEERVLPGIGHVSNGSLFDAPDDVARSFIARGEAEAVPVETKRASQTSARIKPEVTS